MSKGFCLKYSRLPVALEMYLILSYASTFSFVGNTELHCMCDEVL